MANETELRALTWEQDLSWNRADPDNEHLRGMWKARSVGQTWAFAEEWLNGKWVLISDGRHEFDSFEAMRDFMQPRYEQRISEAWNSSARPAPDPAIAAHVEKNAERGWTGRQFSFEGAVLGTNKDGSGYFAFLPDEAEWDRGENGKDYCIVSVPAADLVELRDYLGDAFPRPAPIPEGEVVSGDAQPIADRLRKFFDTPGDGRRLALDAAMMIEHLNKPRLSAQRESVVEEWPKIANFAIENLARQCDSWGRECGGGGAEINPKTGERWGEAYFAFAARLRALSGKAGG